MTDHYANAFTTTPGRCFRMVHNPAAEGQPMHCAEPVEARGPWTDTHGKVHTVDACAGHAGELDELAGERTRLVAP